MTGVEVVSMQLLVAGFLILQVPQIWPLWIKLGLQGWDGVRSFLPISNSAGEYPIDKGVERYASMANSLSFSFFSMFFTFWAARSASQFDCGHLGLLGLISNPNSLAKCV